MRLIDPSRFVPTENELKQALEREEFEVYYQPIVELASGALVAAESLVRWQHPMRGLITPGGFIDVAEECGFSVPLSEWVMRSASVQTGTWLRDGFDLKYVSLNAAVRQVCPGSLSACLRTILDETGVDPGRIAIELHETTMANPVIAEAALTELAVLGIPLWIDDFGSGPSGIRHLKHFPFSVLKIDGEFVANMVDDPRWANLVGGLITFAHHLGLLAVAECVTSDAEIALLLEQGCDWAQGWRFSPPIQASEMTALLQAGEQFV